MAVLELDSIGVDELWLGELVTKSGLIFAQDQEVLTVLAILGHV